MALSEWEIPYRALIHPVGFRFFAFLLFLLYSQNKYDLTSVSKAIAEDSQRVADIEKYFCFKTAIVNNSTVFSLLNPLDNPYSKSYGSHTPTYQPGWFEENIRRLFFLFLTDNQTYDDASKFFPGQTKKVSYEALEQIVYYLFNITYINENHHLQNLRDEYRGENKFRDPSVIGSFMDYIIRDAETPTWNAHNPAQFQNVGTYILIIP